MIQKNPIWPAIVGMMAAVLILLASLLSLVWAGFCFVGWLDDPPGSFKAVVWGSIFSAFALAVAVSGGLLMRAALRARRGQSHDLFRLGRSLAAMALVLLLVYVSTFSYWWLHSPVKLRTSKSGRQIRMVEFQFNNVSWHTQVVWIPAFWYMKHVCGYQEGGFAGMVDESVMQYLKYVK